MADIGTGLVVLGSAVGSKEMVTKILGPTADYVGESLRDFAKKRVENVANIFKAANRHIKEAEARGAVPPRVLKEIIHEGSYVDDRLTSEYFGGILASSKSEIPRDDRAVSALKLIQSMSSYEIRGHYVLYWMVRNTFVGTKYMVSTQCDELELFVPFKAFYDSLELAPSESQSVILSHVMNGLNDRGLISNYIYGTKEFLIERGYGQVAGDGLIYHPTQRGAELFLMSHGHRSAHVNHLLHPKLILVPVEKIKISDGYKSLRVELPKSSE